MSSTAGSKRTRDNRIGKTVTVYHDPITRQRVEGKARVRTIEIDDGDELVHCEVRFTADGAICDRWVDRGQLERTGEPA